MLDIYSIGEMVIDFIPGNEKDSYIKKAGGAPANVAIAMQKNHLNAGMCCKVGDDDFGYFLLKTLKDNQVVPLCKELCTQAVTTMAFVTLAENGERTFTFARKPGADMFLSEEDVEEEAIKDSVIIHAGSCSLSAEPVASATSKALRLGQEYGRIVSFDVNYRNLMWNDSQTACTEKVLENLPFVDLLKISEEEVGMFGGEEAIPDLMKKYKITVVVETLGKNGADVYFGNEVIHADGRKTRAVDATGAGDAFWGGFLSSLRIQGIETVCQLTKEKLKKALDYGNAAGFLCVQQKGAIDSLPGREKIEQVLKMKEEI
ncbi:MAG: carbohydrate kinase [Eubacteriales bacterium]|nr:carbohydrate kinase [Eubacteriales bacterium]